MPKEEDSLVGEVDEKILALDAWKLQIHCSTLALLAEARGELGETRTVQFPSPSRNSVTTTIAELSLSLESEDVEGVELCEVFLVAKILDRRQIQQVDVAFQIARAALQSDAEGWRATTYGGDSFAFSAIVEPSALAHAEELAHTENLPEGSMPGALRLGLRAHYARKHGLVSAQLEGSSILSLCGYWFVPTTDHTNVETCGECAKRHDLLGAR